MSERIRAMYDLGRALRSYVVARLPNDVCKLRQSPSNVSARPRQSARPQYPFMEYLQEYSKIYSDARLGSAGELAHHLGCWLCLQE